MDVIDDDVVGILIANAVDAILEAFRIVHATCPATCLVIAGGASLLDHDAYQAEFAARHAHGNFLVPDADVPVNRAGSS